MTNQRRMTDIFRESNLAWIRHCHDQQKSLIRRSNRGRRILEGATRLAPNVFCIRFTCEGLHLSVSLGSSSLIGRQFESRRAQIAFLWLSPCNFTSFSTWQPHEPKFWASSKPNEKLFHLLGSSWCIFLHPCKKPPQCVWTLARRQAAKYREKDKFLDCLQSSIFP